MNHMISYIRLTPISPRLPNPAMLPFHRPSTGILPRFSRPPIGCDNAKGKHSSLICRQPEAIEDDDTYKSISFLPAA